MANDLTRIAPLTRRTTRNKQRAWQLVMEAYALQRDMWSKYGAGPYTYAYAQRIMRCHIRLGDRILRREKNYQRYTR